jgi:hypothetical protein
VDGARRRDEPRPEPADEADDRRDGGDAHEAAERDRRAHERERHGVGDEVPEARVQKRRGGDLGQRVDVARMDAVGVEVAARGGVDDLRDPHERHHRGDEHQRVGAIGTQAAGHRSTVAAFGCETSRRRAALDVL